MMDDPADNTLPPSPLPPTSPTNDTNMDDDPIAPSEPINGDVYPPSSPSPSVRRARSRWQFVRSVVLHSHRKFDSGQSSSLTTAEATFLNMIAESRLEADRDIVMARGSYCGRNASSPASARFRHARALSASPLSSPGGGLGVDADEGEQPIDALGVSGRTHFSHIVKAAMAKERLRNAISARLADLSAAETNFLTRLVADRHVKLRALQNAVNVLNNDPMYNPKLRRNESELEAGGMDDDEEKEGGGDGDDDGEKEADRGDEGEGAVAQNREEASPATSVVSPRKTSGIKSSAFFDKVLDASVREKRERGGAEMDKSARKGIGGSGVSGGMSAMDMSVRRRRRKAGVAESKVWNLARGGKAEQDDARDDSLGQLGETRFGRGSSLGSTGGVGGGDFLSASVRGSRRRIPPVETGDVLGGSVRIGGRDRRNSAAARYRRAGSGGMALASLGEDTRRLSRHGPAEEAAAPVPEADALKESIGAQANGVDSVREEEDAGPPVESVLTEKAMRDPLLDNLNDTSGDFLSQSVRLRGRGTMMKEGDILSQSSRRASRRSGGRGAGHRDRRSLGKGALRFGGEKDRLVVGLDQLKGSGHARMASLRGTLPMLETLHSTDEMEGDAETPTSLESLEKSPQQEETEQRQEGTESERPELPQVQQQQEEEEEAENVSVVQSESHHEAPGSLAMVCCGAEGISLLETCMADPEETENGAGDSPGGVGDGDFDDDDDSLAAKKRYLHLCLDDVEAEHERQTQLSTWMGDPEDYPILGLDARPARSSHSGDEDDDGNEDREDNGGAVGFEDPLEPHVLSPLLMKCLREHLPYASREENFWLRYSLVRDGASLDTVLDVMRHSQHTVLAIETTHGEVLGSFTSSPWRSNGSRYYGSCEAFVWMLRKSRRNDRGEDTCRSLDEYVLRESSLDVFQWNARGGNRNVQLSNHRKLFVGGGNPEEDDYGMQGTGESEGKDPDSEWGMALALDHELLRGTSSRCATFDSIPLIDKSRHEGLEVFEIMNMEIWALTPCMNEEMAEELELGKTFVMGFH